MSSLPLLIWHSVVWVTLSGLGSFQDWGRKKQITLKEPGLTAGGRREAELLLLLNIHFLIINKAQLQPLLQLILTSQVPLHHAKRTTLPGHRFNVSLLLPCAESSSLLGWMMLPSLGNERSARKQAISAPQTLFSQNTYTLGVKGECPKYSV